ncbi:MAG: ABC transporter permease [Anaerolineales bacterium]|nr:ABC transporter permease [Anaerolineales bacterium]
MLLFLRRLLILPLILLAANFLGFAYAHVSLFAQALAHPFGGTPEFPNLIQLYGEYVGGWPQLNFGQYPIGVEVTVPAAVLEASGKSLGLLFVAALLSMVVGLALGLFSVRVNPPGLAPWLTPLTSFGLAIPSFYLGTVVLAISVWLILRGIEEFPLPLGGFGWDAHLIMPVLALMLRPTLQIAQVTSNLILDEVRKQYVVTARSVGNTWHRIRWRHVLMNALASIVLTLAGAFRLTLGELVLVEWMFSWPGLGRMLVMTLLAPRVASIGGHFSEAGQFFLNPPLLAALITFFALLFTVSEVLSTSVARAADPRLRTTNDA